MKNKAIGIAFTGFASVSIGGAIAIVGERLGINNIVLFVLVLLAGVSSAQIISKKLEDK